MSSIIQLPVVHSAVTFTRHGARYNGMNYYEFPYDAPGCPSLPAIENIERLVKEAIQTFGIPAILEEIPTDTTNGFAAPKKYYYKVIDAGDTSRELRSPVDAHHLIYEYIVRGLEGIKLQLTVDQRMPY